MSVQLTHHCIETNFHAGKPVGLIKTFSSFKDVYTVGDQSTSKAVVVIFTDIFGNKYNNNQLIADAFAKSGYFVLIPDLFENDAAKIESFGEPGYFDTWKQSHGFDKTGPYAKEFLAMVESEFKAKKVFAVGHCYGGKLVIQNLTQNSVLAAGAVAHTSGTDLEEVKVITKPILVSSAENDHAFTDEIRHQTQQILKENKVIYQFDLFSDVSHGYAVRGDPSNPAEKYAADKTFRDQLHWFDRFSS